MSTNTYDLGNGKFRIVATYQGQRKDRTIEAPSMRAAQAEQRKHQGQFENAIRGGELDRETAPILWRFCAAKTPDSDPPVQHGAYHLHILNRNRIGARTYSNRIYTLATLLGTVLSDGRTLGEYRLDEIGPEQILEYQNSRSENDMQASTINGEVKILRSINRLAVTMGIAGVRLLTKDTAPDLEETTTEAIPWTSEQMSALLESSWRRSRRLHGIVLLIANTGMRRGEAINLQWSGVDFDRMIITLRPSKFWKPKNKKPREIPIGATLAEHLRSMRRESLYVFVSRKGEPYACWPQLQFDEARAAAGLEGGPHRLRHTFASHFLANWSSRDRLGDPMMTLAMVLGHSHVQMTKRYSHLLPGHLDNARGLVDFGGDSAAQTKARAAWVGAGYVKRRGK